MKRWRRLLLVVLLGWLAGCTTHGGAVRDGKTFVHGDNPVVSYEVFRVTGLGVGDGWNII